MVRFQMSCPTPVMIQAQQSHRILQQWGKTVTNVTKLMQLITEKNLGWLARIVIIGAAAVVYREYSATLTNFFVINVVKVELVIKLFHHLLTGTIKLTILTSFFNIHPYIFISL